MVALRSSVLEMGDGRVRMMEMQASAPDASVRREQRIDGDVKRKEVPQA